MTKVTFNLSPEICQWLSILHRGGTCGYWWTAEGKYSEWWQVGAPAEIPQGAVNVYVGVHPTDRRRGRHERARISDIVAVNCLFAEFDANALRFGNKAAALVHINTLPLQPSVIVDSGGGYHCYWLLRDTVVIATEADRERIRRLQAAWVMLVGGDQGAKDLARVLRVPSTRNYKPQYAPDFPVVAFVRTDFERVYALDELGQLVSSKPSVQARSISPATNSHGNGNGNGHDPYATAALHSEIGALMLATDGKRNTQLNKSAYALGQLIGAGALDRSSVETLLLNSARAIGLGERESLATIQSGLAAGIQAPRHAKRPHRKNENANADAPGDSDPPKSPRQSQATRLVETGMEASLFHTPDGEAYAVIQVRDHRETWSLRSKGFRRWFARRFFELEHKAPSSQALQDALSVLEGHALYEGAEQTVHTRVGEHDGKVYLDLVNDRWQVVEISNQGWRVTDTAPIYFRRTRGMLALPYPMAGRLDEVRPFLNLACEDDWRLLASWLVGGLRERGPYPVLVIHGGQGSAKSTLQRIVRSLIDPNAAPLRSEPREERDLMIAAVNGWVIALDNLSNLPPWLSDGICRLATGGGFATRELYSDSEEVLFDAQRPVILNGIEELAVRGDLLDRSIVLYLPEMSDTKRRDEKSLWEEFHAVHPRVLGGMLNAVSAGLRNLPTTKVSPLPRMADFALWSAAIAPALGWKPDEFQAIYTGNRTAANDLPLEASPVVEPLFQLISADDKWGGTATELLTALNSRVDEKTQKQMSYPKSGRSLSNALRRLVSNLKAVGVQITFDKREPRSGRRLIHIEKVGNLASPSSPSSPAPENREFSGDDGVTIAVQGDDRVAQDCAKIAQSDGGDDGDDEIPALSNGRQVVEI